MIAVVLSFAVVFNWFVLEKSWDFGAWSVGDIALNPSLHKSKRE